MYLPLSFKKHEQNVWLNWPLDWSSIAIMADLFVRGSVWQCAYVTLSNNGSSLFSYLFEQPFRKLQNFTRPCRFHFLRPSEIIWTLGGWENTSFNSYSNSDLPTASFLQHPTILFFLNLEEWVEFKLPLLLFVFEAWYTWEEPRIFPKQVSQILVQMVIWALCFTYKGINIHEFKQYYLILSMSL